MRNRLLWLDLLRGASALIVCMGHLKNVFLVDYGHVQNPNFLSQMLYVISGLGHQAVIVFFVLSGYLVGGGVLKQGASLDWGKYFSARLTRLWVVLVPALVLTAALDGIVMSADPAFLSGAYRAQWHSLPGPGEYGAGWRVALGNLLFLQTVWVPFFGTNGVLWSLANEAWYYLLFPILCGAVRCLRGHGGVHHLMLAALILYFMPMEMRWLMIVWSMGALLTMLPMSRRWCRVDMLYGSLGLIVLVSIVARSGSLGDQQFPLMDLLLGCFVSLFVICVRNGVAFPAWNVFGRLVVGLSDTSYSLYLIHVPILVCFGALAMRGRKAQPDLMGSLEYFGILVGVVVLSRLFWWLFERNTDFVKDLMYGTFLKAKSKMLQGAST
jgi:peptidoglycan/LPS O-acetylase OafA/YrhL